MTNDAKPSTIKVLYSGDITASDMAFMCIQLSCFINGIRFSFFSYLLKLSLTFIVKVPIVDAQKYTVSKLSTLISMQN